MSRIVSGQHNGFTLIEVMAALLISIFLLSGVISIALSSKQSSIIRNDIDRIQEDLRLSSSILTRIVGIAESLHQDSNAEQIIVSYNGGEGAIDCLGNSIPFGTVVNRFYVKNNILYCGTVYSEKPDSEQPLMNNVAQIRIQYGIDENQGGQVDHYTKKPNNLDMVVSIRITLKLLDSIGSSLSVITLTVAMRPRIFAHLNKVTEL